MPISLAYSPCPNDTFMFHAIAAKVLELPQNSIEISLHDIETLNKFAILGKYDITKLSFHAFLHVSEVYELLDVGAALGYGCGPILVSKERIDSKNLTDCIISVPGEFTTANLLMKLYAPDVKNKIYLPYDQVIQSVLNGKSDCGLIIHESRFVFENYGLRKIIDLGEWWERENDCPIPLGGFAIKKSLGRKTATDLEYLLRKSIAYSTQNSDEAMMYVRENAQELEFEVIRKHIKTFVNNFSLELGIEGKKTLQILKEKFLNLENI